MGNHLGTAGVVGSVFLFFFFCSSFFLLLTSLAIFLQGSMMANWLLPSFQSTVGCDLLLLHTVFYFSHFNVDLLTECRKKSVFVWHKIQVYVVAMGLVPTTIPH